MASEAASEVAEESAKSVPTDITAAVANAKTPKTKFAVLKTLIEAVEVSDRDILDAVFNLLVGGDFDLEVNFIIQDSDCIIYLLEILDICSVQCQAEIWSKFKGICRKSYQNLQACVKVGLVQKLLEVLPQAEEIISELLVDMLSLLASYNITVKELKQLLSMLKGDNGKWPPFAVKLLGVLQATTEKQGPDCFFSFPGKKNAAIALPPIKTWPYSNGFTFTTWFRLDPLNSLRADMDKPYLYCFRNHKGMGFSGHFVGNCFIVTVLKSKGKGFQHCVKYEFKPRKWYMVTIVHIYSRWGKSEVKCYANGQLASFSEMNWHIGGSDQYDKCFLGSAESGDDSRVFCGQMAAAYVFSEALNPAQVFAMYQLGPSYKNQFKYPTESDHILANHLRKVLYEDNKLSDSIVLAYNPKSTDGQLCLECSPRSHHRDGTPEVQKWFVHSPHALMLQGVQAVVTHSIHSALHSVGGAEVLFPLFAQLDFKQVDGSIETTVCATLLNFLLQLLQGSVKTRQQVLHGKGFLVVGALLEKANKDHITTDVLNVLIAMAMFLDQLPNAVQLMRQFCDHILFNPALWIHTKTKVQVSLYTYLATEFVSSPTIQTSIRRVSTVLLLVHALKHYYWVVNPQPRSGILPKGLLGPRPSRDELLSLRAFILLFLKQLITKSGTIQEDELQSLLGYLLTIHEDDNLLDVLQLLVAMLSEHGSAVVPVFDRQNGIAVIFKLLGSQSELVRIHTLKLLAYFLRQCDDKRKTEFMEAQSLFMLISERLLLYSDQIGVPTYNAMYEIMVEMPCTQVLRKPHQDPTPNTFISNPAMMKVTANMLRQCPPSPAIEEVKILFLHDLVTLFQSNRDNRRTLLQQSVWQDWMLSLGYLHPKNAYEERCQELVYRLFRILLYHAMKLEWGGWRVWVDTLAIVHSKVAYEDHKAYLEKMYAEYKLSEKKKKQTGQVSSISRAEAETGQISDAPPQIETYAETVLGRDDDASCNQEDVCVRTETGDGDEENLVVEVVNPVTSEAEPNEEAEETPSEPINVEEDKAQDEAQEDPSETKVEIAIGDHPEASGSAEAKEFIKTPPPEDVEAEKQDLTDPDPPSYEAVQSASKGSPNQKIPPDVAVDSKEEIRNDEENKRDIFVAPTEESGKEIAEEQTDENEATDESDLKTREGISAEDEKMQDVDSAEKPENVETKSATKEEETERIVTIEIVEKESAVAASLHETEYDETKEKDDDDVKSEKSESGAEKDTPVEGGEEIAETTKQESVESEQDTTEAKGEEVASSNKNESNDVTEPEIKDDAPQQEEMDDATSDKSDQEEEVIKQRHAPAAMLEENHSDVDCDLVSAPAVVQTENQQGKQSGSSSKQEFSPGPRTVVFRVPEFKWSDVHLRLLDDLFLCLEGDIDSWKSTKKDLVDIVNSSDNLIFLHNTLHLVSQLVDNIILACGGILPILSSATSPNYELDTIESSQGLSMDAAWNILDRLINFMDVLVLNSTINLAEIESDKNMQAGGILRQSLRAACMCAVRNCLEVRYLRKSPSVPNTPKYITKVDDSIDKPVGSALMTALDDTVSAVEAARILLSLMPNHFSPIIDPLLLLQDNDIERLRGLVYRDLDDTKQTQYLALAVVYFVSVLMVSKYRDILDPDSFNKLQQATIARRVSPRKKPAGVRFPNKPRTLSESHFASGRAALTNGNLEEEEGTDVEASTSKTSSTLSESGKVTSANVQDILRNLAKPAFKEETSKKSETDVTNNLRIQVTSVQSSFDRSVVVQSAANDPGEEIAVDTTAVIASSSNQEEKVMHNGDADHTDLPTFDPSAMTVFDDSGDISSRLERSMDQLAPLLRDIFLDFASYLSKTLLGSHGQELLNEGLVCMRSYTSVVELVMLLCSQEWQNSLQKNAGLAFIELINEGRLLCHGMMDHVVKVANEADFILSKQRAEDVKKHAQFGSSSAIYLSQQREEERQCDALITAARHRDHAAAQALKNRITNILTNKLGAWGSAFSDRAREYWMLDTWEDDTRRRRRFMRNPYGHSHKEATLSKKDAPSTPDAANLDSVPRSPVSVSVLGVDKLPSSSEEEEKMEEVDLDELQGPVSFTTEAYLIAPGACLNGVFSITPEEFFFEVNEQHQSFVEAEKRVLVYIDGIHGKWLFQEVRGIFSRRYLLQNTALEIFLANRTCVMFNFSDHETVKKVVAYLPAVGIGTGYGLPQERRISLASPHQLMKSSNMTERWQRRDVSNFEYLMFLNTIAGRTFNDLNQYPVFPWILSNYDVAELDLSLASNYRDLSKPIGALNPKRSVYFQSRYDDWEDSNVPKFHYGTHYSNAAFTLGWLLRVEPFTSMFLSLQGGKFDHADRSFHSVLQSWKNCQRDSHDVKELIPEFFYLPEMFLNSNSYELGSTSDDKKVDDVILPPWAKSADDFVQLHRLALESEIVSCQIHQWIDLIFGFKQRGPEAVRAVNVFYYLTYENSFNIDQVKDPIEKAGLLSQIKNFGQTPSQLLSNPHPPRSSIMNATPLMFKESATNDVMMVLKFQSNSPVVHLAANTHPSLITPAVVTCTKNLQFCINKWNDVPNAKQSTDAEEVSRVRLIDPDPLQLGGLPLKRQISDMLDQSVNVHMGCFIITADNRFVVTCGYWDRSFRIMDIETVKLHQVVFGHWDVVTCLTRSETYIGGDCYFVTGSRDATVMLWYWSGRKNMIVGDVNASADENPSPRAVLTGHDTEITCVSVCAELGLIASGSLEGPILLHTITGDLLRSLEPELSATKIESFPRPERIVFTGEGMIIVSYAGGLLCNFTMNGRSLKMRRIDDSIKAMLASNDGQFLITGGDKCVLSVWRAWDFEHLHTYPQCDVGICSVALSHDQNVVITGMMSGSIVAFSINFNKWRYEYENKN